MNVDPNRPVGPESRKSFAAKLKSGFFDRYLSGKSILDIGYKGGDPTAVPIMPSAIGVDLDYPGYDGRTLPFASGSQDAVYCSHCLEHVDDYRSALREWFRVLKAGGYLIIAVPHQFLFERRIRLPSTSNLDHKRFYTPGSLLKEIEESFEPNSYRIRHLIDNDMGYDYSVAPPSYPPGCQEIELVVEKIPQPSWELEDGTSRIYGATDFFTHLKRTNLFYLDTDFSFDGTCAIYGPYQPLRVGNYRVTFHFEAIGLGDGALESVLEFDVAQDMNRVASVALSGHEGADTLRNGSVTLTFSNDRALSQFEFRVFTFGQRPYKGSFRFYGVALQRSW
jgi:SAM-dependent methyltransferase